LHYNFHGAGLPVRDTRWIYSDFISSKVAKHEYWATIQHRLGYVGYQSKHDHNGKYSQFQCSNWDSKKHNAAPKSILKYCGPGVTCKRFGHEGSGWQTHIRFRGLRPQDGRRMAFAIKFEDVGQNNARVTCWFQAPGVNNGKWFKQAIWEGPAGSSDGTHAVSFLEQFAYDRAETAVIREGLYGTVWGRGLAGPWKPVTSATSSTASKVQQGWTKVDWGIKASSDGQKRWYLAACGCKFHNECPGQEACTLSNTGGSGSKSLPRPVTLPDSLKAFNDEIVNGVPTPIQSPTPTPTPTIPGSNPVLNRGKDCWGSCGGKGGLCSWCGQGHACCRKGWTSDPKPCKSVPADQFLTWHHECVPG